MGTLLALLAGGYAVLAAAVFAFQSHLLYFPNVPGASTSTPAAIGLAHEDVRIETSDAQSLAAWFVPAPAARGVALLFHGNAGSIADRLDWLPMFQRLGLSALLVDYRGYGRSGGHPTEQGTYRDAEASWAYLTDVRGVPPDRIVLFGESLGGAVAAWLASRRQPGALVLLSTFTSVPDLAAQLYPWLPARLLSRFEYATLARLGSVRSPVLVAHSPRDEIVPYAHGRRLFEAAGEPKQFVELAGGHNEAFFFIRSEWERALGAFLDGVLRPRGGEPSAR